MIPREKVVEIAQDILRKSQAGKVRWKSANSRNPMARIDDISRTVSRVFSSGRQQAPQAFEVVLPHSRIYIEYTVPTADPDVITFDICRVDDTIVGSLKAQDGTANWDLLLDLYQEASRTALKWDEVLLELEGELKSDGVMGRDVKSDEDSNSPKTFLDWAAGEWVLRYSPAKNAPTASERVTIHSSGVYDANGKPSFKLTDIELDRERNTVSFDKHYLEEHPNYSSGKPVLHRECLKIIPPDTMRGHRDGVLEHTLEYTRQK